MLTKLLKKFYNFDYVLIMLMLLTTAFGIIMVASADYSEITRGFSDNYHRKQLLWTLISFVVFVIVSTINYRILVNFVYVFYAVGLMALVYVVFQSEAVNNVNSWIRIAGVSIQPSEIFKIVWALTLAHTCADHNRVYISIPSIVKIILLLLPPAILIAYQPDLGTLSIYVFATAAVIVYVGIRRRFILLGIALVIIMTPLAFQTLKPYQQERLLSFISLDDSSRNYQVHQSLIAIGSGGIIGKGYMEGQQTHLKFIPEVHNDLIFAVIGEEFGLIGGIITLTLLMMIIYRVMQTSRYTKEPAAKVICITVVSYFFVQVAINISMVMGLFPVVGIPIPLVSYGGSSMLTYYILLGLVNSIYISKK